MMPSLMIDHLSINLRSGTDNLVSEISFAIKEGESLILLGQSGSGKTMTCSAVLNLLDPKKFKVSGSVFFGKTDLLNSAEKQRRGIYGNQIVYIPQNPMTALDPSMRIGRQMDETLRLHSDKSRQQRYNYILRLLHDVGLDDPDRVYRAYPHMLSGGMLQRVIIAMAMMLDAKFVLADEPTTALDVIHRNGIIDLFSQMKANGVGILMVTHDFAREAVSYAVNQQELETSVFDGLETAAETLFTNEKPNCGVEVKTYPTDMEKAKQLMKEAGYEDTNDDGILEKDGTSLAIHFNYSQSLASVDNAVLSFAASLKELGFDVTIDAVDMNTWYGALMAGEYDLTFYNTAGGSFDPATDMSNMAPGAMGDPILCQFSAFFENPEIFAELDSTSDSQRVQEIYGMILNGIANQNLLVPVTGTHDLALWNTDKITGYDFYTDASYVDIASVHVK